MEASFAILVMNGLTCFRRNRLMRGSAFTKICAISSPCRPPEVKINAATLISSTARSRASYRAFYPSHYESFFRVPSPRVH